MVMHRKKGGNAGSSAAWLIALAVGFISGSVYRSFIHVVGPVTPLLDQENRALSVQVSTLEEEKQKLLKQLQAKQGEMVMASTPVDDKKVKANPTCNLSSQLDHLQRPSADYPAQRMFGPMQADEMLSVFSIIRASSVRRVLEVGGWKGDSAWNFLEAVRCKEESTVYTVDKNPVKQWDEHPVRHKTLQKDAATLTLGDIEGKPIDALLLDCHAFHPTQEIVRNILKNNFLAKDGFIFLHDTGLHPKEAHEKDRRKPAWNDDPPGFVHQPVERLIAQWLQQEDCGFQRISLHDDTRFPFRHGLTIMQRRANLHVDDCTLGTRLEPLYRYDDAECTAIQSHTSKLNETCPVA